MSRKWCVLGSMIVLTLLWSVPVIHAQDSAPEPQIDPYIALFGGIAMPFNTDRRVDDNTLNNHFTVLDAAYGNSKTLGGKIGMWFPGTRRFSAVDLGVELDVTNYQPDIQAGTRRATGPVNGVPVTGTSTRAAKTDVNSTILAVNGLVRLPMYVSPEFPHGRFYPYIGGGIGMQNSSYDSDGRAPHDLALQGLAGVQILLTRRVALFAEYKFTHAQQTFTFGSQDQTINFDVSHLVAGLAVHLGN